MAKELKERVGESLGYYDSRNGEDIDILKSVDITDECPNRKDSDQAVILDFSRATEGVLFKLTEYYPGENYGSGVMNFLHDFQGDFVGKDVTGAFCRYASMFGLTPYEFLEIVKREALSLEEVEVLA